MYFRTQNTKKCVERYRKLKSILTEPINHRFGKEKLDMFQYTKLLIFMLKVGIVKIFIISFNN